MRHFSRWMALGLLALLALLPAGLSVPPPTNSSQAHNVILFIGDGMGFSHVTATRIHAVGMQGTLAMEGLPRMAQVSTYSANSLITDSAAATTAIATGQKTDNGKIAVAPDGTELETILEIAQGLGKATGLATTTRVTHATPAAFAAHNPSRNNEYEIAQDYVRRTRPELILGGGAQVFGSALLDEATQAGYNIVRTKAELDGVSVSPGENQSPKVLGLFADDHLTYELDRSGTSTEPHLWEMTAKALELLSVDPDGFFLMVEGGRIDHASHSNDLQRAVLETWAFDRAVETALSWAEADPAREAETLILVTADHETGGLAINGPSQLLQAGEFVEAGWTTTGHTGVDVPLRAAGPGSEAIRSRMDNTEIFVLMREAIGQPQLLGERVFRVTGEGDVYADGAYYGADFRTGGADIAEYIKVSEPVEPGDVVELDPSRPGYYRKSRSSYSALAIGVISPNSGITIGRDLTQGSNSRPLLALMGVVPVKATTENGPIRPGDLLTASSTPGYAMRCDDPQNAKERLSARPWNRSTEPLESSRCS